MDVICASKARYAPRSTAAIKSIFSFTRRNAHNTSLYTQDTISFRAAVSVSERFNDHREWCLTFSYMVMPRSRSPHPN
jgi:hypothetical protein